MECRKIILARVVEDLSMNVNEYKKGELLVCCRDYDEGWAGRAGLFQLFFPSLYNNKFSEIGW